MPKCKQSRGLFALLLLAPLAGCESRPRDVPADRSTVYTRTQGTPAGGQGGADSSTPTPSSAEGAVSGPATPGGDGSATTPGPSSQRPSGNAPTGNVQKGTGMGGSVQGSGQPGDQGSSKGMIGGSPPGQQGVKGTSSPQTGEPGAKGDKGAAAMREHELHKENPPPTGDTGGKTR
jgi:hypothetical protein